jgi:hypothetical protein
LRATLFKEVGYSLSKLIEDIDAGEIALPEIQRPFVWSRTKVRDLFDSMYNGFPVGYLLFWASMSGNGGRYIGVGEKQAPPRLLIVDGQQRLTSLYAVLRGLPIVGDDYSEDKIRIAFRPRDAHFAVPDATTARDPEFIPDITELWVGEQSRNRFVRSFIGNLRSARDLSDEDEDALTEAIDRLFDLQSYPFTALELSSSLDEEQVAEVFVRINSKGVTLNQADFILTLMSVFWEEGRKSLEEFSRAARQSTDGPSPYNHFIKPAPDQLLRVAVGLGFRRGQLRAVYSLLRGRDVDTEELSAARQEEQFDRLRAAQERVLELTNWHEFLKVLVRAGYRSGSMITSETGVLYSYVLFLIGRCDFGVELHQLREVIARWFFMSSLTGRYSASPESSLESDLARLRGVATAEEFVATLEGVIEDTLTNDFWQITLPNQLATSAGRSPSLFGYYAALNLLDARVLFSKMRVSELFDPALKANRASLERHHLFPRGYLHDQGITAVKDVNQIANLALLEWPDNVAISDRSPADYYPEIAARFDDVEIGEMARWHALPHDWHTMDYDDFLVARRKLLAGVIREGFGRLRDVAAREARDEARSLSALIAQGEHEGVEFKSSARWNYKRGDRDPEMELVVARAVAGLLNGNGGTLLVGVDDDGNVLGLDRDYRLLPERNRDKYQLWLSDFLGVVLGKNVLAHISIRFEETETGDVCRIDVRPSPRPVFLNPPKSDKVAEFYVRMGNATRRLTTDEVLEYEKTRWGLARV